MDSFLEDVLALLGERIREKIPGIRDTILNSGRKALRKTKADLMRWNLMLAAGTITSQEYEWLVEARMALIQVDTLKASGIGLVRIDEFRMSLVQSIVGAALGTVGL
jgi:hypothetical protein